MIQENLTKIPFSEGPQAEEIKKEIRGLTVEKLHKIKDPKKIKNICDSVINGVEMKILVSVDEGTLESRKLQKNKKSSPPSEHEVNMNGVILRNDWASKGEIPTLQHGYIYHDSEGILGIIYNTTSNNGYRAFIKNGIANNPHGASLLMGIMKKRFEKLMQKNIKSHE